MRRAVHEGRAGRIVGPVDRPLLEARFRARRPNRSALGSREGSLRSAWLPGGHPGADYSLSGSGSWASCGRSGEAGEAVGVVASR